VSYVCNLAEQYPALRFKIFYFNESQKIDAEEKFVCITNKEFMIPKNIEDIIHTSEIYIHNYLSNPTNSIAAEYYHKLFWLQAMRANLFILGITIEYKMDDNISDLDVLVEAKIDLKESVLSQIMQENEKIDKLMFINSLSQPIDEEKIKDMYCPNAIGFLATQENLEDEEFVGYIKELIVRFPDVEFKGFYLREDTKQLAKNIFSDNKIQFIIPKDMYDIAKNIEIYASNASNPSDMKLFKELRTNANQIYCAWINLRLQKTTIQKYEVSIESAISQFMKYYELLGFSADKISSDNSYSKTFQYAISTRFGLGEKTLDLNNSAHEYFNFQLVEYAFGNTMFKEFFYNHVLGQYKALYGDSK
jgi:hypothetical protein